MTRKSIPIVLHSRLLQGDIDTPSDMGVGSSHIFVCGLFLLKNYVIEADGTPAPAPSSSALIRRDQDSTVTTLRDSAAGMPFLLFTLSTGLNHSFIGEFLQSRTFRGLETRAGLDPPSILQQGRTGVARGYGDDH